MSLNITCFESKRGPALKVVPFVKCNGYGSFEIEEGPFTIDDCASVMLKFSAYNPDHTRRKYTVWISVRNLLNEKTVKVNATCKQLNFSRQLCAHDGEQQEKWQIIGSILSVKSEEYFELSMIASRVEIFTFAKLYDDTELTDFLLRSADGGTVVVHKACLAAHSDVFKTMLLSKFKETTEGCIEFKDVTQQTLEHFKKYIYFGTLPDEGVEPLLLLAKCYMMTNLLEAAVNKACQTATAANLYSLLQFATENNIPELALGLLQMANDDAINEIVIEKQKPQPIGEPSK